MADHDDARRGGGATGVRAPVTIDLEGVGVLIEALRARGYRVIGPRVRDGAIVQDEIASAEDLPAGWTDAQEAGTYRLERRADGALFGYNVGPHSPKRFLFPPEERLWRAERSGRDLRFETEAPDARRLAFLGLRACEIRAIAIQDRVFLGGAHVDAGYASRRAGAFIVAVQCGQAAPTCFCASMGTGPRAEVGFDLALTEILEDGAHRFVVEIGSEAGAEVATALSTRSASADDTAAANRAARRAESQMRRAMNPDARAILAGAAESSHWATVAERCLTCANCTLVCPTCFCNTVVDTTDLSGDHAERWRHWDSCFTTDFSYIHGGSVRTSGAARYRQWITHKLGTWHDQFDESGCVGCGRCITWCPVGIDLTVEVSALAQGAGALAGGSDEDP